MSNEMALPTNEQLKMCLQQQLDEFDMLTSIFCNPGELKIDDHSILADINQFLNGTIEHLHRKLDYIISLSILKNDKLEIHFELPHSYPELDWANIITIRCSAVTNNKAQTDNAIKQRIQEFIELIDKSEVYIYQIVVWVQENIDQILAAIKLTTTTAASTANSNTISIDDAASATIQKPIGEEMERLWIYSHHLKSRTKRQDIIKWAKELELSGFSRPGKPGIICVEGRQTMTSEFWKIVRQWSWHRICVRTIETKVKTIDKIDTFRRFNGFTELIFADLGDDNVQPMDMSLFMRFLEQHNCKYITKDLFGFE